MVKIGPESVVVAATVAGVLVLGYIFMTYMAILAVGIMIGAVGASSLQKDDGLLGRTVASFFKQKSGSNKSSTNRDDDDETMNVGRAMRKSRSVLGHAATKIGNMIIEELSDDEEDSDARPEKRIVGDKSRPGRKSVLQFAQLPTTLSARKYADRPASPPRSVIGELFG